MKADGPVHGLDFAPPLGFPFDGELDILDDEVEPGKYKVEERHGFPHIVSFVGGSVACEGGRTECPRCFLPDEPFGQLEARVGREDVLEPARYLLPRLLPRRWLVQHHLALLSQLCLLGRNLTEPHPSIESSSKWPL